MKSADEVFTFWFVEHGSDDWFSGSAEFDDKLKARFAETHDAVAKGEAASWRQTPKGRLAEILVLDQFSRQLYRDSAAAFAWDGMALVLAQEMVARGDDQKLDPQQRSFVYMPYMHSESLKIHEQGRPLFVALDNANTLEFEDKHAEILRRFGRYPKRNEPLGRQSTPEEKAYLDEIGDRMF